MPNKPQVTDLPDNLILQRTSRVGGAFGLGSACLVLKVFLPASARVLEYRLRDHVDPSTTHLGWVTAASYLPAGTHELELIIPAQRAWYLVDIRLDHDDSEIASTQNRIGAGDVIVVLGQSLAVDFFAATNNDGDIVSIGSLGIVPSPFCAVLAAWYTDELHNFPPVWFVPGENGVYRSAFAAEFLSLMVRSSTVNCGLVGYGRNGQAISQFAPNTANNDLFKKVVRLSGGRFCALIYIQGHGDSIEMTSSEQYRDQLTAIIRDLAATFGSFASVYCSIPSLAATTEGLPIAVNRIRAAQIQFAAESDARAYVAGLDTTLDQQRTPIGVHPNQKGDLTLAQHFYRSAAKLLGHGSSAGDEGPIILSAALSDNGRYIDLSIRHTAGTALVGIGAPIDQARQFKVFRAGTLEQVLEYDSESPIDLTSPGRIRLKLALPVATGEAIDIWYRLTPDSPYVIEAGIYDNALDDDGISRGRQLQLSTIPFTIQRTI